MECCLNSRRDYRSIAAISWELVSNDADAGNDDDGGGGDDDDDDDDDDDIHLFGCILILDQNVLAHSDGDRFSLCEE